MKTGNKKTEKVTDANEHERSKKIHHNLDVGMHDKDVDSKFPESSLSKNSVEDDAAEKKKNNSDLETLADDVSGTVSSRSTSNDPNDLAGIDDINNDLARSKNH